MKKQNTFKFLKGLSILLVVPLIFQCGDVIPKEEDPTTENGPLYNVIATMKNDPQMLNVFVDKILSDPQLENDFMHHPWIIASSLRDSIFIELQVDLLQSDSTISQFFFNQLSANESFVESFVKNLYNNQVLDEPGRDNMLLSISKQTEIKDLK